MVTDTGYAPQKFDNNWLPADELGTDLGDTMAAPADGDCLGDCGDGRYCYDKRFRREVYCAVRRK